MGMIGIREHPRLGIRKSLIFAEKSKGGPLKARICAIFEIRKSTENPEISKNLLKKMFPCSHVPRDFSEIAASPRRPAVIAADSILQGEGETISRRHERGCVLSGSGRAYHGVAINSVCLIDAGDFVSSTPASEKARNV